MTAPKSVRFRTRLNLHGKTATGFEVPDSAVEQLGSSRRPPVKVTIGKHAYRSTVVPMGGRFMLPLAAEHRTSAGVSAGEMITVTLELDTAERTVTVPADLASAMRKVAGTRAAFDSLSYTRRKEIALAIETAKKEETRRRRIDKAIAELKSLTPRRPYASVMASLRRQIDPHHPVIRCREREDADQTE